MKERVRIKIKPERKKEHKCEYRECEQFGSSMCKKVIYREKKTVYVISTLKAPITAGGLSQCLLTLCPLGNFSCLFVVCRFIFQINFFEKILSAIPSKCQTDWTRIRPDVLLGLIWVQSVCKGYEQTTLVGNELTEKWRCFRLFA